MTQSPIRYIFPSTDRGVRVQARAIIWYITAYQTKKQLRSFNWSAILAEALAYHFDDAGYFDNLRERNRLLIFRCLHIMNRQMEQSGQQVISYLLGLGDKFCSHSYTPLYWSSVAAEILRVWPHIKEYVPVRVEGEIYTDSHNVEDNCSENGSVSDNGEVDSGRDEGKEEVILEALPSGALVYRSQLTDYKFRGRLFDDMSFFDFIADTWEDDYRPLGGTHNDAESSNKRGAPPHLRDSYLDGHPSSATRQRVRRAEGHNMLPNIVGPYLPRNDNPSTYQFYCASMLALLKPWRDIQELLLAGQSWSSAFASFLSSATPRQRNIISGAQYYYQCRDAADQSADGQPEISTSSTNRFNGSVDETVEEPGVQTMGAVPEPTEGEMLVLLESMQNQRELLHGQEAVAIARGTNLFRASLERSWSVKGPCARTATQADLQKITGWREAMVKDAAT